MGEREAAPRRGPSDPARPRPARSADRTGATARLPERFAAAFGITSPRRAAMLAIVVVALALSVAVPLRNYLTLQGDLAAVRVEQQALRDQVGELERRRDLLEDPDHIEAQARVRLRYVRPGETPYIVQLPPAPQAPSVQVAPEPVDPWYTRLWRSINGPAG